MVILTVGNSSDDIIGPVRLAKEKDIQVFTIGLHKEDRKDTTEIDALGSYNYDRIFCVTDFDTSLLKTESDLLRQIHQRVKKGCQPDTIERNAFIYTFTMINTNSVFATDNENASQGTNHVTPHYSISTNKKQNTTQAPSFSPKPSIPPSKSDKFDLIIVLDGSSNIHRDMFNGVLDSVAQVVREFNIGPDGTHVGLVQYSDHHQLQFQLNKYFSDQDVVSAIKRLLHLNGGTMTGRAIKYAAERGFSVDKVVFLMCMFSSENS